MEDKEKEAKKPPFDYYPTQNAGFVSVYNSNNLPVRYKTTAPGVVMENVWSFITTSKPDSLSQNSPASVDSNGSYIYFDGAHHCYICSSNVTECKQQSKKVQLSRKHYLQEITIDLSGKATNVLQLCNAKDEALKLEGDQLVID